MAWAPSRRPWVVEWARGREFLESGDPADVAPWAPKGAPLPRPGFDYLGGSDPSPVRCLGFLWDRSAPPRFYVLCADVETGREGEVFLDEWAGFFSEHPRHAAEAEEADLLASLPAGRNGGAGGL